LIHRRGRVLGGPAVRAAFGGHLSLTECHSPCSIDASHARL
jgi:hypothetical protein